MTIRLAVSILALVVCGTLGRAQEAPKPGPEHEKFKAARPEVERLITLAKEGDLHARRQALAALGQDKFAVHKLFEEVAPRYADRPGGYTRILKLGPRRSDATEMVYLELV